jgi:uncharacterized UBP type Zn finger protein
MERRRQEIEHKMADDIRRKLVDGLSLTGEQVAALDSLLARAEETVRNMVPSMIELQEKSRTLMQQARDNGWTREQSRMMVEQATREFAQSHQGELLDAIDDLVGVAEEFRPHLSPEQIPRLDETLATLQTRRTELLEGKLKGL